MELLKVDSVDAARQKLLDHTGNWCRSSDSVSLDVALDRMLFQNIYAGEDIPAFRRSTVDGYAVVSADTGAAGETIPVILTLKGQVEMGQEADFCISTGECAYVPTGGMLPEGADAVVMVEYSEPFGGDGVALYASAAKGEHVVEAGEDVSRDTLLLPRGKRLLPGDVGALAAAGYVRIPVFSRPRMAIISTGDELISPDQSPLPGQIRDINTHALLALAEKNGFSVTETHVARDNEDHLASVASAAMEHNDLVVISGGSSQGQKDATRVVIDRISSPGVFTHGLAVRPGKPTILGWDEVSSTLLAGLPGHPVSAMMVFEILICWLNRQRTGTPPLLPIPAGITCNVPASPGKTTCYPARLTLENGQYRADPVFGKSGLITTLTQADGYFEIPRDKEGLAAGEQVLVHLF